MTIELPKPSYTVFLSTPSARRATAASSLIWRKLQNFYPRPPRGGRPYLEITGNGAEGISIHALREEGDAVWNGTVTHSRYFYPRPPRGGRLGSRADHWCHKIFLSTPSARRATIPRNQPPRILYISIHALREEGDLPQR